MQNWEILGIMALALFGIYCITIKKTFVGLITIALAVLLAPFLHAVIGK